MPSTLPLRCRCGHSIEAHEHFRAGSDCAVCGPDGCQAFVARRSRRPQRIVGIAVPLVEGQAWNRFRGGRP